MPPFRNPFGRKPPVVNGTTTLQNENAPPTKFSGDDASQRSDYASSRASSSLSIKKREEPSEYKLSGKLHGDTVAQYPPLQSADPKQWLMTAAFTCL